MTNGIDWAVSAAWVQSIGSLVGIGIAIYVPYRMHLMAEKAANRRDIRQARLLSPLVMTALQDLLKRVESHESAMRSDASQLQQYVSQMATAALSNSFFVDPALWQGFRSDLFRFGSLGDAISDLEYNANHLQRIAQQLVEQAQAGPIAAGQIGTFAGDTLLHLEKLRGVIARIDKLQRFGAFE